MTAKYHFSSFSLSATIFWFSPLHLNLIFHFSRRLVSWISWNIENAFLCLLHESLILHFIHYENVSLVRDDFSHEISAPSFALTWEFPTRRVVRGDVSETWSLVWKSATMKAIRNTLKFNRRRVREMMWRHERESFHVFRAAGSGWWSVSRVLVDWITGRNCKMEQLTGDKLLHYPDYRR